VRIFLLVIAGALLSGCESYDDGYEYGYDDGYYEGKEEGKEEGRVEICDEIVLINLEIANRAGCWL